MNPELSPEIISVLTELEIRTDEKYLKSKIVHIKELFEQTSPNDLIELAKKNSRYVAVQLFKKKSKSALEEIMLVLNNYQFVKLMPPAIVDWCFKDTSVSFTDKHNPYRLNKGLNLLKLYQTKDFLLEQDYLCPVNNCPNHRMYNFSKGRFNILCSCDNEQHTLYRDLEVKERSQNSLQAKYGVKHALQVPEFRDKLTETNLSRYGVQHAAQADQFKKKSKETNQERYGADHYSTTDEYRERVFTKMPQINTKREITCLERYNEYSYTKTTEFKERYKNKYYAKAIQTNLKKYGVDWYTQTDEAKAKQLLKQPETNAKAEKTCLKRYGDYNYTKSVEFKEKVKRTRIKRAKKEQSTDQITIQEQQQINNFTIPELLGYAKEHNMYSSNTILKKVSKKKIDMDRFNSMNTRLNNLMDFCPPESRTGFIKWGIFTLEQAGCPVQGCSGILKYNRGKTRMFLTCGNKDTAHQEYIQSNPPKLIKYQIENTNLRIQEPPEISLSVSEEKIFRELKISQENWHLVSILKLSINEIIPWIKDQGMHSKSRVLKKISSSKLDIDRYRVASFKLNKLFNLFPDKNRLALIKSGIFTLGEAKCPVQGCNEFRKYCNKTTSMFSTCGTRDPEHNAFRNTQRKKKHLIKYGTEHPMQRQHIKDKSIRTCLVRFNAPNAMQNQQVKDKLRATNLKKYGVDNYAKTVMWKESTQKKIKETIIKMKITNLHRYGCEYAMQNKDIQLKGHRTCLSKYGTYFPSRTKEVKDKTRATNLSKYGYEFASQSKEVKDKIIKTNLKNYGTMFPSQSKEVKDKTRDTFLYNQGYQFNDFSSQSGILREENHQKQLTILTKLSPDEIKLTRTSLRNRLEAIGIVRNMTSDEVLKEYIDNKNHLNLTGFMKEFRVSCVTCYQLFARKKIAYAPRVGRSNLEIIVGDILKEHEKLKGLVVSSSNRTVLKPKELDIFIPYLKIAIEINGVMFHSIPDKSYRGSSMFKNIRITPEYHKNKTLDCLEKNVSLIHIDDSKYNIDPDYRKEYWEAINFLIDPNYKVLWGNLRWLWDSVEAPDSFIISRDILPVSIDAFQYEIELLEPKARLFDSRYPECYIDPDDSFYPEFITTIPIEYRREYWDSGSWKYTKIF